MKRGKPDKGRLLSSQKTIRMKWSSACIVFDGRSCGSIRGGIKNGSPDVAEHLHSEREGPSRMVVFKPPENARRFLMRKGRQLSLPTRA
jgi:hypothetical protein